MSTSFNWQGQWSMADVDYKRMYGQPGVGFYRWTLGLSLHQAFRIGQQNQRIGLRDIRGELLMKTPDNGDLLIARFTQHDNRIFEPYEHTRLIEFQLEEEIDSRRINAIETIRRGGDLHVKLKLRAIAFDCETFNASSVEAHDLGIQITQSDWIKLLNGMDYRKSFLLEVEAPYEAKDSRLADSVEHLKEAHHQLYRGHFKQSVAECRNALEVAKPFFKDEGKVPEEVKAWLKTDREMTKEQRLARIGVLMRKLTSLAHHSDTTSKSADWGPEDAKAILAMTAAILQMIPNSEKS